MAQAAVARIDKPNTAIRVYNHIIRRIKPLTFEGLQQHGNGTVNFGSRDPTAVLTCDQAALSVSGVAVGVVRALPKNAHGTVDNRPPIILSLGISL